MADTVIYCIKHPDDNTVWYVGKTHVGIEQRFYEHMFEARSGESAKCKWIRSLVEQGKQPIIEVIETCEHEKWPEREQFWIRHYREINPELTNGDIIKLYPDEKIEEPRQTAKLWTKTIRKLALLRGYTGEPAISIVGRLVEAELAKVEKAS